MNEPVPSQRAPASSLGDVDLGLRFGLGAALAVLCLLVYLPALSAGFVYDDHQLIEGNRTVVGLGAALRAFFEPLWAFDPMGEIPNAFWRPLTVVVIALGRTLFGLEPAGFHGLSLLLHLAATWAAWRLATRLLRCVSLGWLAAALFAAHPVHVESVAWAAALNDPLYSLFALLSLERYLAWRERGLRGVPWAAGVTLLVALLAKEQALIVPAVALVIDLAFRHLRFSGPQAAQELARAYAPWALAVLLYCVGRVAAYGDILAGFDQASADFGLSVARAMQLRLEIMGGFLEGLFWPLDPRFLRQVRPELPADHAPWTRAIVSSALWAAATAVAAWRGRRLALAMLVAAPVSCALLLVDYEAGGAFPISDRYLYLPVVFATVLVVGLLAKFLPRAAVFTLGAGLVALAGWVTSGRVGAFHDDLTLMRAAVEAEPDNMRARVGLGNQLLELYHDTLDKQLLDEATYHFLHALMLGKDYGARSPRLGPEHEWIQRAKELDILVNGVPENELVRDETVFVSVQDRLAANIGLGNATLAMGNLPPEYDREWPRLIFEQIVARFPDSPEAWDGLGRTRFYLGDFEGAEQALRTAVDKNRAFAEAWFNLGVLLSDQRRFDEARVCFDQALVVRPGHLKDLINAARCAIDGERWSLAEDYLGRMERLHPRSLEHLFLRGMLQARRGDLAGALRRFDALLARFEEHPRAHLQRGKALAALGNREDGVRALRRAAELDPGGFEAHYQLVNLLLANPEVVAADVLPYLERAYALSPPNERRAELHRLLLAIPTQMSRVVGYARLDQERRDFVHALSWVEAALSLSEEWRVEPGERLPTVVFLTHLRGQLYEGLSGGLEEQLRQTYLEQARDAYLQGLNLAPEHFFLNHDLALLLASRLGQPEQAIRYARRARENLQQVAGQLPPGALQAMDVQLKSIAEYVPR